MWCREERTASAGATHAEINYKLGNNYFSVDRERGEGKMMSCRLGNEGGRMVEWRRKVKRPYLCLCFPFESGKLWHKVCLLKPMHVGISNLCRSKVFYKSQLCQNISSKRERLRQKYGEAGLERENTPWATQTCPHYSPFLSLGGPIISLEWV